MDGRKLLPDVVRSPSFFAAVHVLPQAVLALILWRAWGLVSGEIDADGRGAYTTIVAMQAVLTLAALTTSVGLRRCGATLRGPIAMVFLVLNIAFLWASFAQCDRLVPATVSQWMLDVPQLLFAILALVAPALFYNALCVAGFSLPGLVAADIGGSVAALVLIPAGWYIFAILGHRLFRFIDLPYAAGMSLFIVCTAVVTFAFLRLLLWLYRSARGTLVPALLAGLVLPFGGLALNAGIPFPVSLQYWPVYVLTGLNAIALLLPFRADHPHCVKVWFARLALYPFSLYFFILFLPFLPLSIIAMIAAGAGFLILAPCFLFVVHSRMLYEETRVLARRLPPRRLIALLVAALALLPAGYLARATVHRVTLMRAVNAVFAPDLAKQRPAVSPAVTRAALSRLQAMKEGIYLPFLSEIYNGLVFDGMVLPDHKVKTISEAICGEDLAKRPDRRRDRFGTDFFELFLNPRRPNAPWANRTPPQRHVALGDVRLTPCPADGPLAPVRMELLLTNQGSDGSEYAANLVVPPAVSVSGFELMVGTNWVPGRIFDRKAALWVYHMIRDTTRRDPGLLTYTAPGRLSLSVFPFAHGEQRRCAITFTRLSGDAATLSVDGRAVELDVGEAPAPLTRVALPDGRSALYIPAAEAIRLPAVTRPIRAHFLLDASVHGREARATYHARVERFLKRHPWITETAATAVNLASEPICPPGMPAAKLPAAIEQAMPGLAVRGGFCPALAIRRLLFTELTALRPSTHATLFVTVPAHQATACEGQDDLLALVPDARVIADSETIAGAGDPVLIVQSGRDWACLPTDGGWVLPNGPSVSEPFMLQSGDHTNLVLNPGLTLFADSRLAAAALLRRLAMEQVLYPAEADTPRGAILRLARESGILAPGTAYMVVENSAQWRSLERAESQALKANSALEFDEFKTPEPGVWLVLAGFASWLALRRLNSWRRCRR